jgi:hypothetical protein
MARKNPTAHHHLRLLCLVLALPVLTCSSRRLLRPDGSGAVPKVATNIAIASTDQLYVADTLAGALAERLRRYSAERGDYVLADSIAEADILLTVSITGLHTSSWNKQMKALGRRKNLEQKYARINADRKPMTPGQVVAANVVANVVANALLAPFGFIAVTVINDQPARPNRIETRWIERGTPRASVSFEATLTDRDGAEHWHARKRVEVDLVSVGRLKEQVAYLVREILFSMDGKMPLFRLPDQR